jgi:hypothetical protein
MTNGNAMRIVRDEISCAKVRRFANRNKRIRKVEFATRRTTVIEIDAGEVRSGEKPKDPNEVV